MKKIGITVIVLLAFVSVALFAALVTLCQKVHEFDKKHGCDVFANLTAEEIKPTASQQNQQATNAPTAIVQKSQPSEVTPPEMKVEFVQYDGDNRLKVFLSQKPDMNAVRNFITVSPLKVGDLSFRYDTPYFYEIRKRRPVLTIIGEFAHRTNVTLKIAKGLPLEGKGGDLSYDGSLKNEFVYTFRRKDIEPYVRFDVEGRYLPPVGKRSVLIEAMNSTNVFTAISRVEPANIVQLLAREENVYRKSWYYSKSDSEEMLDLSGEVFTKIYPTKNIANEKEKIECSVSVNDGKSANGIYLLQARVADHPKCEWVWRHSESDNKQVLNPIRYRLVCVSDIGLSARRMSNDKLGVWVTSLTTGKPLADVDIEVYSSARIKVMQGKSNSQGWCEVTRIDKGEPFAVVAIAQEKSDMSFIALRDSMLVDESPKDGARSSYRNEKDYCGFMWTDRGIYRHGEKIFVHCIFRNGLRKAHRPFPVEFILKSPEGKVVSVEKTMVDEFGAASCESFIVTDEQNSGIWLVAARLPGSKELIAWENLKIEDFAPPQVRVKVDIEDGVGLTNFAFNVSAEHLFGEPAKGLACEGAVVFEDVAFAPSQWKGWHFGNNMLGLKPSFRRLKENGPLDENGKATFSAPLWALSGLPKAAVRATAQGIVIENSGRPAAMRKSVIKHFYPYYIGSTLPGWVRLDGGRPNMQIACVAPDGKRFSEKKKLNVVIESIEMHYSYKKNDYGQSSWYGERVRKPVASGITITTDPDKNTTFEMPIKECGDYAITIKDEDNLVSYCREFYLGDWGDETVRSPLSDPTKIAISLDKAFYRPGETPRLVVKSPIVGAALLTVMREKHVHTEVFSLTNATSEITLKPVRAEDAPNLEVFLSVVQGAQASARRLAFRAHGRATISIRPIEDEISVSMKANAKINDGGSTVEVDVVAPGADYATVAVVDEGINILTAQETPNPISWFALPCIANSPLYDIYSRVLPVVGDDKLKKSGVKTGGGMGAEMLSRVSPVGTRRFKPLSMWRSKIPVVDGKARCKFELPDFAGEVRVVVVAYSKTATGAASTQLKISPKVIVMPDAPRFVAPSDVFDVSLPIYNRSGKDCEFSFSIQTNLVDAYSAKNLLLPKNCNTNIICRVVAPNVPGDLSLKYKVEAAGENHSCEILLPVRPAVAWRETAGVKKLSEGEKFVPEKGRFYYRYYDTPLADYARALEWLCEYPYGCLEQTVSRVFSLISAGGIFSGIDIKTKMPVKDVVSVGVGRVVSMVREKDFVMWPDCDSVPWDRDVSVYAAHFLVAAKSYGVDVPSAIIQKIDKFLNRWVVSKDSNVSSYAAYVLALKGDADKDRMYQLYREREKLSLLSKARLGCAFALIGERKYAKALLENVSSPSSIKEASFAIMALLELDPSDERIVALVKYLQDNRDKSCYSWGTTSENAHALMAVGEYYRYNSPKKGEKFVAWRKLELPNINEVKAQSNGVKIIRRLLNSNYEELDYANIKRGDLIYGMIELTFMDERVISDLVIEDLFAGGFEPAEIGPGEVPAWVLRTETRDDRLIVFSEELEVEAGEKLSFVYPLRVVSTGEYVLPGVSVEAMYMPAYNAKTVPEKVVVVED